MKDLGMPSKGYRCEKGLRSGCRIPESTSSYVHFPKPSTLLSPNLFLFQRRINTKANNKYKVVRL